MTQGSNQKVQKKGKLIIFSAPSGAGKTTLVKHLLQQNLNLEFSISATSRARRNNETDGKDYYFITNEDFHKKVKNDEFLEWEEVYSGIYYGTLKSEVERILDLGKNVIFDVDVEGGLNIKKYYKEKALAIFVLPPSIKELEKRLRIRSTETEEKIRTRVTKAILELNYANRFDKIIKNRYLEEACQKAEKLILDFLKK